MERGCLTLDFLTWLGQERGHPAQQGAGEIPSMFCQKPHCVPVTRAWADPSLGRKEKLFLIVHCATADWLPNQAELSQALEGEEELRLDLYRARSLGAREGGWEYCCVSDPGRTTLLA